MIEFLSYFFSRLNRARPGQRTHIMYGHNMTISDVKRSPLALAILVLLYEAPMYVYRMQQVMRRRGEDELVNISQPNSIYQTIVRLERSGLMAISSVDRESNRPERTVYELTDAGKEKMVDWTREYLSTPSREFPHFPAAISVLAVLSPKDALKHMNMRIGLLKAELARLDARIVEMKFLPRLFRLEIEFLQAKTTAELSWVQSIVDDLKEARLTWNKTWLKKEIKELGPGKVASTSREPLNNHCS